MAKLQLLDKFAKVGTTGAVQNETVKTSVVKGHVNKLLFVFPNGAKSLQSIRSSSISCKHVSKRITNLITKMDFWVFLDMSDEKHGSVVGQHSDITSLGQNYISKGGTDDKLLEIFGSFSNNEKVAVLVDLGSFMLDNGDELDITFDRYARSTQDMPEMHVYSVLDDEFEAYNMLSYDVDYDQNELHRNVRELYLHDKTYGDKELDIYIDSPSEQFQTNNVGLQGYAMLTGRFENQNPEIYNIYRNSVSEDVQVKVIGADANDVGIVAIRVLTDFEKYEAQQRETLLKQSKIVETLEKNEPATASVMQASNIIPSSVELMNKADEFKN